MARVSIGWIQVDFAAPIFVSIFVSMLVGCTAANIVSRDSGGSGGESQAGVGGAGVGGSGGDDDAGAVGGAGGTAPDAGDDDGTGAGGGGGADAAADVPFDTASDLSTDTPLDAALDASLDAGDVANDAPVVPVMPSVAGQLVISEIMIDTSTITDDDGEWFEIHNPSATVTYDLDGCVLSSGGGVNTVNQSLILAPGAFISLARVSDPALAGFTPTYSYGATLKFSNSGGSATVTCGPGATTVIDTVTYTIDEVVKGSSFSLSPDHYDATENDVAANWCHSTIPYRTTSTDTDYGTPAIPNPPCP